MIYTKTPKKLLPLFLLEILNQKTDQDHKLTQVQLVSILENNYGLVCERKSISRNISYLMEAGYDIRKKNGYYLAERDFDNSELKYIIDGLTFSKNIPNHQRNELIDKIAGLSNEHFKSKIKNISCLSSKASANKQLFYTIDILDLAISKNCQVSFLYNSFDKNKKLTPRRKEPFLVNPYQITASNGRYYLICNYDKYDSISHYRIDRITDIKLVSHRAKNINKLESNFDLPKHMAEHIYMCFGDCEETTFLVSKPRFDDVIDWFEDFDLIQENDDTYLIKVNVNKKAMVFWCLQYGQDVEVLTPESLRNDILKVSKSIMQKYDTKKDHRVRNNLEYKVLV